MTDVDALVAELNRRLLKGHADAALSNRVIPQIRPVTCADGFKVFMQASEFHYCTPRSNDGPWYTVELGFPSAPMPALAFYNNGDEEHEGVWGFVPLKRVAEVLVEHGGLLPA